MGWQQMARDFEPDGSLRDIYVLDADLADWQRVLEALHRWTPLPTFSIGGKPASLPDNVGDIFGKARQQGPYLAIEVSGVTVGCHFFADNEIEFDLDPREVVGPIQLEGLQRFMAMLGRATRKPVVMTMENAPEAVILRYTPDIQRFDRVGGRRGWKAAVAALCAGILDFASPGRAARHGTRETSTESRPEGAEFDH